MLIWCQGYDWQVVINSVYCKRYEIKEHQREEWHLSAVMTDDSHYLIYAGKSEEDCKAYFESLFTQIGGHEGKVSQ